MVFTFNFTLQYLCSYMDTAHFWKLMIIFRKCVKMINCEYSKVKIFVIICQSSVCDSNQSMWYKIIYYLCNHNLWIKVRPTILLFINTVNYLNPVYTPACKQAAKNFHINHLSLAVEFSTIILTSSLVIWHFDRRSWALVHLWMIS